MASIMYDYIRETPEVLTHIIDERARICAEFVERFKGADIETVYVIGSGTSYHAGVSAKLYLEELTGWKVIPMIGIRIQRDALFRFTPITNVSSMKPSARMNSTTVKRT